MRIFLNVFANQPSGTSSINRQRENMSEAGRRAMQNAGMGRNSNASRQPARATGIARDGRTGRARAASRRGMTRG